MAFGQAWGGVTLNGTISSLGTTEIFESVALSGGGVINNVSRISRLLVRYRLQTTLVADDIEGDGIPWPVDLGVMYTPQPDNEAEWHPGQRGGGASWRETVQWRPQSVARTGVPSTLWWAQPEEPRSTPMQRIIHDQSTALLWFGFGYSMFGELSTPTFVIPDVTGWIQIDYLLSNIFI